MLTVLLAQETLFNDEGEERKDTAEAIKEEVKKPETKV